MLSAYSKRDYVPWLLGFAMCFTWIVLSYATGTSLLGPTSFNSYSRQAMAWRQGLMHLPQDVPHLELAVYQGEYYVSFPPLPSVVLWPLTFIFGMDTPDNLLVKLYALAACLMMYFSLRQAGYSPVSGGLFAFFFCFSSSMLPLTMNGAVWYHAQVLAFMLTVFSVCFLCRDMPAASLLCCALAVGCRPFNALYLIPLLLSYRLIQRRAGMSFRDTFNRLYWGLYLGFCVALALGLYNYLRFGNPLEFGHNYLPEFSTQGGVQFSIEQIGKNAKTFLWGWPLKTVNRTTQFEQYGYSMLLACPTLSLMLFWAVRDCRRGAMRWEKAAVALTCLLHVFFLLQHRTFGGFQLGARYAVDLVPYSFLYLMLTPEKKRIDRWEAALLAAVFLFTCVGFTEVHV